MFLRPIARSPWRVRRICLQPLTEAQSQNHKPRSIHNDTPPFPTIPTCPSPSCNCAAMPAMPEGLPIDHTKSLNGTMAPYAEQVLICTGKDDWLSKIEDENSGDNLAADIKELMGRGGMFSDVCFPSQIHISKNSSSTGVSLVRILTDIDHSPTTTSPSSTPPSPPPSPPPPYYQ